VIVSPCSLQHCYLCLVCLVSCLCELRLNLYLLFYYSAKLIFVHFATLLVSAIVRSIFACDRHFSLIHRSDVDECLERNVCPGGGCQNTIGSYICIREKSAKNALYKACPPGYEWHPLTNDCAGKKKRILKLSAHLSLL